MTDLVSGQIDLLMVQAAAALVVARRAALRSIKKVPGVIHGAGATARNPIGIMTPLEWGRVQRNWQHRLSKAAEELGHRASTASLAADHCGIGHHLRGAMTVRDTRSEAGSPEWFTEKSRLIGEDAWALDSVACAGRSLRKIHQLWDSADADIHAGLFSSAVVSYWRPFTSPREYSIKDLKDRPGFDRGLHDHFRQLRHKLLAHADSQWFQRDVGVLGKAFRFPDGTSVYAPALTYVRTNTLHSVHSKELLTRQLEHVNAVVLGIAEQLHRRQMSFLECAWKHSQTFERSQAKQTHFTGKRIGEVGAEPIDVEFNLQTDLPPIKSPPIEVHGDGYKYRVFRKTCAPRMLEVTLPDGSKIHLESRLGAPFPEPERS